jgi:DNA-binding transcriptional regulator YhcF (GntR family)
MLWQVDPAASSSLYEQVASSVRTAIADGRLQTGERLPAAKDVADALDINVHTVLKAYQQLRHEGLIELHRGRGAVVARTDPHRSRLRTLIAQLHAEGDRLGLTRRDLADLVERNDA